MLVFSFVHMCFCTKSSAAFGAVWHLVQKPPDSTGSVRERRTMFEQATPDHEPGSEQQGVASPPVRRKSVLSYAGKIHADLATQACIEEELKAEAELAARRRAIDKRDAEFAQQLQTQLQHKELGDLPVRWETFIESDQVRDDDLQVAKRLQEEDDELQVVKRLQEEEDLKAAYDLQTRELGNY